MRRHLLSPADNLMLAGYMNQHNLLLAGNPKRNITWWPLAEYPFVVTHCNGRSRHKTLDEAVEAYNESWE